MKTIEAYWRNALISWYYTGIYWCCSTVKRNARIQGFTCRKTGVGVTKDDAFMHFVKLNGLSEKQAKSRL